MSDQEQSDRCQHWLNKMNDIEANVEELDDVVIDISSMLSANINNAGLTDQIEFILQHGSEKDLEDCYKAMVQARENV